MVKKNRFNPCQYNYNCVLDVERFLSEKQYEYEKVTDYHRYNYVIAKNEKYEMVITCNYRTERGTGKYWIPIERKVASKHWSSILEICNSINRRAIFAATAFETGILLSYSISEKPTLCMEDAMDHFFFLVNDYFNIDDVIKEVDALKDEDGSVNQNEESISREFFVDDAGTLLLYRGDAKRVRVPSNVIKVGPQAFMLSDVENVIIPESVREIGYRAFYGCNALMEVLLETYYLKIIEPEAFSRCAKLETIVLPKTDLVMDGAFSYSGIRDINLSSADEVWCYALEGTPFYEELSKEIKEIIEEESMLEGVVKGEVFSLNND